jgi:hypothetical protein
MGCAVEVVHRIKPPERGVDAAGVPEVRLAFFRLHVFRDLAVRSLETSKGVKAFLRVADERFVARGDHAESADGSVPAEDAGVIPVNGFSRSGRRDHAVAVGVILQEFK